MFGIENKLIAGIFKNGKAPSTLAVILLIVIVIGGLMLRSEKTKVEKLEEQLAQVYPDTVKVVDVKVDTLTFVKDRGARIIRESVVTSDTVRLKDTIFITNTVIDTGKCKVRFKDNSNIYVSIEGWLNCPDGSDFTVIYKNKKLRKYENWVVLAGAGWRLNENQPYLKSELIYRRIGIGSYLGKGFYGISLSYRL